LLTDTQLKELGLIALGHRMRLRDYYSKRKKVGSNENERKEKLEKLRALIGATVQSKSRRRRLELRVPCEPRENEECAVLRVRHSLLGKVNRRFKTNSTMDVVYDWVSSLNLTPKYFSLSVLPGKPFILTRPSYVFLE